MHDPFPFLCANPHLLLLQKQESAPAKPGAKPPGARAPSPAPAAASRESDAPAATSAPRSMRTALEVAMAETDAKQTAQAAEWSRRLVAQVEKVNSAVKQPQHRLGPVMR